MKKYLQQYNNAPVQVKASLWFLICSFLQKCIQMITTPIFTRLLNTSEYGEFNVYNSWLAIVSVFVSLNLYAGVFTKGLVKYEEDKNVFSSSMLGLCTTCNIIGFCIYILFKNFFNHLFGLSTFKMVLMFVSIWASSAFSFWSAYQRVEFKYKALVFVTVINSIIKPVCSIIFVVNASDKVTARILAIALIDVISFGGLYLSQMCKGKKIYQSRYWKYAIRFSIPLVPHYLSMIVLSSSDRIMIERMVGADVAGIYSLAYSISQIVAIFNTALFSTVEPWLYKKLKENRTDDIGKVAYITLIIIAGVIFVLIAFAPEVVMIFAPLEYREAIWVIPPVAMSVYFVFAYTFFAVIEFHYDKTKYISYATMLGAILNIVLNYIFIGLVGYMAAGYTTLICYVVYAVAHYMFSQKICNEKMNGIKIYDLRILATITMSFVIIGFVIMATYKKILLRYTIIGISFVLFVVMRKKIVMTLKKLLNLRKI